MRIPSLKFLSLSSTICGISFLFLLFGAFATVNLKFIPLIGIVWQGLIFGIFFVFLLCLSLALHRIWRLEPISWKKRLLYSAPWIGILLLWSSVLLITGATIALADSFTNDLFQIRCVNTNESFYLQDGNTWMDDDPGSANRIFTLYRRHSLILEPIASADVHTRGDSGYQTVNLVSTATEIQLFPSTFKDLSKRYTYIPASRMLSCK